jgi:hypothetical protein
MQMEVMGQNVAVSTGFDGKDGWVKANGMDVPVEDKVLAELQEASFQTKFGRMTFLKDKSIELTALAETKLDGKTLVGVKVASKGRRDFEMYFDKESGLLTKVEKLALDPTTGTEVKEERIVKEYQEVDGIKVAKKLLVNRDGKKFLEMEVEEVKFLDKVEDSTFAKP